MPVKEIMFLLARLEILPPIRMLLLSILLPHEPNSTVNIVVAAIFFLFNAICIPGYLGIYDKVLISISLVMDFLVMGFAWKWE